MNTTIPDPDGDLLAPGEPATDDANSEMPGDERSARRNGVARFREWLQRPDDALVGGVAADLAARLGLDVLWVRLAFVVLLLVGGLGAILYAGLWLTFIFGAERGWARVTGGAVLLVLVPLLIANADLGLATGTGAVVILLLGLTLALWSRGAEHPIDYRPVADAGVATIGALPMEPDLDRTPARTTVRPQRIRTRRPPSVLGRATFGAAMVVAAGGALIDELNGGRLHPEQWLGAAAVVCGLGLLVGALRGHARWLIVPAAAFALVGYVAGESAGLGLTLADVSSGNSYRYISEDNPGVSDAPMHSVFSSSIIDIPAVPSVPAAIEVRGAFGDLNVSAGNEVTIELIAVADNGGIYINGRSVGNGTHVIGPNGDPDLVIDARTLHGEITVYTYDPATPVVREFDPAVTTLDPTTGDQFIGEGLRMLSDGTVIVWDGQGIIGPDNQPLLGNWYAADESRMEWSTEFGTWQLIRSILITPYGQVLDLDELRASLQSQPTEAVVDDAITRGTTTVPPPVESFTPSANPSTTIAPQEG